MLNYSEIEKNGLKSYVQIKVTFEQPTFLYFQQRKLLSEHKKLTSIKPVWVYLGKPHITPPSCTNSQQMTIHMIIIIIILNILINFNDFQVKIVNIGSSCPLGSVFYGYFIT